MNVINFLPNDYLERRHRQRANLIGLAIAAGTVVALGLIVGVMAIRDFAVSRTRSAIERQYAEASRQIEELTRLEEHKADLLRKVDLSAALLERVPRSLLLARLTNHLPAKTSLMVLTMKLEEVEMEATPKADKAAEDEDNPKTPRPSPKSGGKKDKANTVKVKQYAFRLDGLAPTDVEVAEFLARLSADPFFQDVNLQFSEEFSYQEGVRLRRFQLSFRLNPDADKAWEPTAASAPAPVKGKS